MPKDDLVFEMSSGVVSFGPERLSANDPDIEIQGVEIPLGNSNELTRQTPLRAIAGTMSVDPESILFTDGVYLGQAATPETTWSLDSNKLVFTGARDTSGEPGAARFTITRMLAWDGFQMRYGADVQADGDTMLLDREQSRLHLSGKPAVFKFEDLSFETERMEIDLATGFVRSSAGTMRGSGLGQASFELQYASMEPVNGTDSRIQVVREPVFIDGVGKREIRASWGLFWLDQHRLESSSAKLLGSSPGELSEIPDPPSAPKSSQTEFFSRLDESGIGNWLREAYLEGNIEVIERGERRIRAEALYMDMVDGHGWVRDIDITMDMPFRTRVDNLKLHADWMRYSRNGTAQAENAIATSCEFDEPHYQITLGRLKMKTRPSQKARKAIAEGKSEGANETDGFDVSSTDNRMQLGKGPKIPIPAINFPATEDFRIPADSFTMFGVRLFSGGNNAKFGTFFGISLDLPLGWISEQVHRLVGTTPDMPKGRNNFDAKYLHSRGILLGWKNTIEQRGVYRLVTRFDFINDFGEDRGLVRVPEDERSNFRGWLRLRGRRWLSETEWFDLVLSTQTDPGVQSEFFEGDYLRWEQRETYVHWRKADGLNYWHATGEVLLDDYRTEVLDQPTAGYVRGRAPTTRWWGQDLLYSSETSAGRLKRDQGDPQYEAPFADGYGNQEVLRIDSLQRLEMSLPLGFAGARIVPFIEGRGTFWDQGATSTDSAGRTAVIVGAEAAATFWRMLDDGDLHTLTPSLGARSALAVEESGPTVAQFDEVEDPIDGNVIEAGLRSRWSKPKDPRRPDEPERFLDIEVRQGFAENLDNSSNDGMQPLRVNAQWLSALSGVPFGMTHDARYETDSGDTIYSRTYFGVRPIPALEIETGYNSARDTTGAPLYNAWTLAARYNFSPKWQLEGRETFSTLSNSQLSSGFLVRRLGHDFVFEIEYSFIAGEGGGSVGFTVIPLLTYRQPRLGLLDRWHAQDN
jgi:hypothetical protein